MNQAGILLRQSKVVYLLSILLTTGAYAQTSAQSSEYSTFDVTVFGGVQSFDILRDHPAHTFVDGPFGGLRFTQDFSKYVALEETLAYGINNVSLFVTQPHPVKTVGAGVRNYQLSVGPVFHFTPRESRVRPFIRVGAGAAWYDPTNEAAEMFRMPANAYLRGTPFRMKYGPAGYWGAGIKFNASHAVGFRFDFGGMLSQVPHFTLPDYPRGPGTVYVARHRTENVLQASAGITFRFGHKSDYVAPVAPPVTPPKPVEAPKPPTIELGAITGIRDVCPGEAVQASISGSGWSADQPPTYDWKLNGQSLNQNSSTVTLPTTGLTGAQKVEVTVSAGGGSATATGTFSVKVAGAPSVTLSGLPQTIQFGDPVTLNATATPSECCGTPTITYTVSEGTVTGQTFDSKTMTFDNAARDRRQTRVVKVTATATDTCGNKGTASGEITVVLNPQARRLDDLVFTAGSARVNNCAKRLLLEELTPLLRDSPNSRVVLIGHRDERNDGRANVAVDRARVLNAAAVISAGTGICPQLDLGRISGAWVGTDQTTPPRAAVCGTSTNIRERRGQAVTQNDARAMFRRVEVWFVPEGAELPASLQSATPVPAAAVTPLGCPK